MLFKLCYTVNRLEIHSLGFLEFNLNVPEAIRLVLRPPTDEERARGHKRFNAFLDILGEFEPSKRSLPVFNALVEGRRPPQRQKATSAEEMTIRVGPSYSLEHYPNPFVSFVEKVVDKLSSAGCTLVGILRWRYAQEGPPSPISSLGLFCSNDDGVSWHPIPGRYSTESVTPSHSIFFGQEVDINEILDLISSDLHEPVYHELLREAKVLQHSSPRSSVIIAVSALEVAVKFVVVKKIPETEWLFDKQSPPVVDILVKYIPTLFPGEQKFYEADKEDRLIKTINDAVTIRNQIVHKGIPPPSREKVTEIIDAVQELLWICDYYCGYGWAKLHINAMRKEKLSISSAI
jgi:hypothetical protein